MFSLSIVFATQSWRLLYQKDENAKRDYDLVTAVLAADKTTGFNAHSTITLVDDYGQTIFIKAESLHGVMFENLDQTKMANIEYALHGARTQAAAQQRAEGDPALRAGRAPHGPAIISPMGNGRMG